MRSEAEDGGAAWRGVDDWSLDGDTHARAGLASDLRGLSLRTARRPGRLVTALDRLIAASSLASTDAVLDVRDFAWTAKLREHWRAIRDEALAAALSRQGAELVTNHGIGAQSGKWRSFTLWTNGRPIAGRAARCPQTSALVHDIPALDSASFSILAPGAHIPAHRGPTRNLITCHLGLIVPRDGDARMRLDDRVLRWAEGETLVFDDSRDHEVWNETSGTRIVLRIQFRRPLRNPARWLANRLFAMRDRASQSGSTD